MWKDGTAVWKNAFHVFKLLHLRINRIHFICGAYIPGVLNRHNVLLQVDGTKTVMKRKGEKLTILKGGITITLYLFVNTGVNIYFAHA